MSSTSIVGSHAAALMIAGMLLEAQGGGADSSQLFVTDDPACHTATLVSTGGQFPRNPQTLAIRWAGEANYELAYKGQIILLDAYYDRGSPFPPLGFQAADIKRANLILIGHGHTDHMSDAASVGRQTGAVVVGAPVTTEKLLTQSIDPRQVRTVSGRGGEKVELPGITIEPILGRHSVPPRDITASFERAIKPYVPARTPEQLAEQKTIAQRGTGGPRLADEGTITYLITLDTGFRIVYRDTAGEITEYERAAMRRIGGRVEVAIVAVAAAYLNHLTAETALQHARAYQPWVYMPAHHDAPYDDLWRATEPIFQVLKDNHPGLITISKGYREPVCFNTQENLTRRR
ncbi:MAG: MBL fold metallo-hydrolase [Acidobacteria bacterium]|nr:MBL fold metallo-hydrolase [Acidobacteriota bacterium]